MALGEKISDKGEIGLALSFTFPNASTVRQVSQILGHSVHEIDHLIAGLQGVREKLNNDSDRIHREIQEHAAFSRSIIELTGIVNDAMASVNKPAIAARPPEDAA